MNSSRNILMKFVGKFKPIVIIDSLYNVKIINYILIYSH